MMDITDITKNSWILTPDCTQKYNQISQRIGKECHRYLWISVYTWVQSVVKSHASHPLRWSAKILQNELKSMKDGEVITQEAK